jgi:preprotein translocase subunit Sss1
MSEKTITINLKKFEKIQNNIDAIDRVLKRTNTANDDVYLIDVKYILIAMKEFVK